jgi:hypothetical protein
MRNRLNYLVKIWVTQSPQTRKTPNYVYVKLAQPTRSQTWGVTFFVLQEKLPASLKHQVAYVQIVLFTRRIHLTRCTIASKADPQKLKRKIISTQKAQRNIISSEFA